MIIEDLRYLYHLSLALQTLLEPSAFEDVHELVDAHLNFLEPLFTCEVYSTTERHGLNPDDFRAPVLQDV